MASKKVIPLQADFHALVRANRWRIIVLGALTMLESLLQVYMAVLSRNVIDAATTQNGKLLLWGIVLGADVLFLVLTHMLRFWYSGSAFDRMAMTLRRKILNTTLFSRDEKLLAHHSAELLSRGMEDVVTVCDGAVYVLPNVIGQVTRLIATFAAVLYISPGAAGVLFAAAAIMIFAVSGLRPVIRQHHRRVRVADEKMLTSMQENMQQLELIQSMEAQQQIMVRFDKRIKESLRVRFKRRLWMVSSNTVINIVSFAGTAVLLLWGAIRVADQTISYGALTSMLQLLSLFRGPVLNLSGMWNQLAAVDVASERLKGLLGDAVAQEEQISDPGVKAIVLENVTFSYPGEDAPVVENFNFRFPLDGWTCLTGVSGRGKTTIFKLILGLYKPQSGRVYLETEQGEIPCSEKTRSLFAYVPQDYALLSGTIYENMELVVPGLSLEQMRSALSVAQADFVWELSDQENSQLGENNTGLSKGQIQRLAIARAILMDRPIFLLDECTSALDAQTEAAVLQGLQTLGKQAILVTHRPDALSVLDAVTEVSMEA